MTAIEMFYIAARSGIVILCLAGTLILWRQSQAAKRGLRGSRAILGCAITLLLFAAVLTVNDLRAALGSGEQMATYAGATLWLLFDAGVPLLMIQAVVLMRQRDAALEALEQASMTDALTELANRRGFWGTATAALDACQRRGAPASVIMFDLDRFKTINDGFGHAAGDEVLREAAAAVRRQVRASDIAARLGGEEFALFCPDTGASQAAALAERVRAEIRRSVRHPAGEAMVVTTSAGVATIAAGQADLDSALAAADRAMYRAKEAGRDRVAVGGS